MSTATLLCCAGDVVVAFTTSEGRLVLWRLSLNAAPAVAAGAPQIVCSRCEVLTAVDALPDGSHPSSHPASPGTPWRIHPSGLQHPNATGSAVLLGLHVEPRLADGEAGVTVCNRHEAHALCGTVDLLHGSESSAVWVMPAWGCALAVLEDPAGAKPERGQGPLQAPAHAGRSGAFQQCHDPRPIRGTFGMVSLCINVLALFLHAVALLPPRHSSAVARAAMH